MGDREYMTQHGQDRTEREREHSYVIFVVFFDLLVLVLVLVAGMVWYGMVWGVGKKQEEGCFSK